MTDEVAFDPNDLLRQFDAVSLSQRALVAECERQRNRLIELLHWYDQQRAARAVELRRQSEQLDKKARHQINTRSKKVIKERARIQHLLDVDDDDDESHLFSANNSKSLSQIEDHTEDRKRKIYGCLLPQLKAKLTKSCENWSRLKSMSISSQSHYKKSIEKQRWSINKFIESPIEQRNRINILLDKCLDEFGQDEGDGYDHFLQTSEPTRNAQILAQQMINDQNQNKFK